MYESEASAARSAPTSSPTSEYGSASSPSREWVAICPIDAILPDSGVCALHDGRQIAVFRVDDATYAIDNVDPFTGAAVLSRGLVTTRGGTLAVASPLHKQRFALATGECLDDPGRRLDTWPTRVRAGMVELAA
jgi:NAD(P)H-dependent nitrite reductase small subunit